MLSPLQVLIATEDIKKLKARYFRLMDTKDWDGFRRLFTADAIFDVKGAMSEAKLPSEPPIIGVEAIVEYVRTGITPLASAHHGHMPEIDILSEDEATGIWAMADLLRADQGGPFRFFYGYGHYHESYRKIDEEWRIAKLRISRLLIRTE